MAKQKTTTNILEAIHIVGSLESVPEYALELARIVTNWTALEQRFTVVYRILTDTEIDVASATMHQISSSHQKFTIIGALAEQFSPNKQFKEVILQTVIKCRKLASKRNKFVHRQWMVSGVGKVYLIDYTKSENSQNRVTRINIEDMKNVVVNTKQVRKTLDSLISPYLKPSSS